MTGYEYIDQRDRIETEAWLARLKGNLHFKEWTAFEGMVDELWQDFDQMTYHDDKNMENACLSKSMSSFIEPRDFDRSPTATSAYSHVTCAVHNLLKDFDADAELHSYCLEKSRIFEGFRRLWTRMCLRFQSKGGRAEYRPPREARIPDIAMMMKLISHGKQVFDGPICGFDYKSPEADILAHKQCSCRFPGRSRNVEKEIEVFSDPSAVPASELCARYNRLFKSDGAGSSPSDRTTQASSVVHHSVTEAVTHCLSVGSGCIFLFNDRFGVAMKVIQKTSIDKIHVQVSRSFPKERAIIGMVALCMHSIDILKRDESLPEFIANCAEEIEGIAGVAGNTIQCHSAQRERLSGPERTGKSKNTGRKRARSDDGQDLRAATRRRISSNRSASETEGPGATNSEVSQETELTPSSSDEEREDLRTPSMSEAEPARSEESPSHQVQAQEAVVQDNKNKKGRDAPSDTSQVRLEIRDARRLDRRFVLGQGNSGIVYDSTWHETRVAIKEWNGNTSEGLQLLLNEISTYTRMRDETYPLLGKVIPDALLAWKADGSNHEGANEPLLVTKYVGRDVCRYEDDMLVLDAEEGDTSEELTHDEELEICVAAVRSLRKLHLNGWTHGSVHLRNMRVQRVNVNSCSGRPRSAWKVWWIDLGRTENWARKPERERKRVFQLEILACLDLFHTRSKFEHVHDY